LADEVKQQILIAGLGGQGVLFATGLLLETARRKGWDVLASETHGMAQRGGSVVSHIKLGPFISPLIRTGTADLMLALQREEAFRNLHFVKPGGAVLVNAAGLVGEQKKLSGKVEENGVRFLVRDATEIARSAGTPRAGNVAILGIACGMKLLPFSADELKQSVEILARGPRRESNLKVLEAALGAG
jgi:indolepyruvate ferredoxin oxidoreductase beta subunit